MDGEEQPIFDVRCLDEKTRTLIDLVKEKVIYCHLNKSFDDISIPMRFQIKKRVKKLMDLPNYFERLNFIRNSVCGEIDIILNPPKIEEITNPKSENPSWSYTQMCRERLRS